MNGPSKLGTRRSKAKAKNGAVNLLKEINVCGGIVASSMTPKGGCFGFLSSNSSTKRPPLRRQESTTRTPASAPALHRPGSSAHHAKPLWNAHLVGDSPKCDTVTSKKPEAGKEGSRPRWKRRKPGKDEKRFDFDEGLGGKIRSCSAATPTTLQKSVSGVSAVVERKEKAESTPSSAATPPVEPSISPEVPSAASTATTTPVCFATGHMLTGVRDWRKCRPRGTLAVRGGGQQEVAKSHDTIGVSSVPPPPVEASISWLSSDTVDANRSLSSSFRVHRAHIPSKGSDFENADDMRRDDVLNFVLGTKASVDHRLWSLSSDCSDMSGSPKPSTLFDFNSPSLESITSSAKARRIPSSVNHDLCEFSPACSYRKGSVKLDAFSHIDWSALDTTPSSGINIQKTPTTGDSVSPFSLILESLAKTSKHKFPKPQQERRGHRYGFSTESSPSGDDSLMKDNVIRIQSSSSCIKQLTLSPIAMGQLVEALGDVSLSPEISTNVIDGPTSPPLSFQFECPRTSLSSVDLDHFQKPSCGKTFPQGEISVEEQNLSSNRTRISWREGLVSRMFEMGELDCSHWFSDYQDNCDCGEDEKLESVSDLNFCNETRDFASDCDEHLMSASLGSTEFASEAVIGKSENTIPSVAEISCAESVNTEKLQLSSSSDSDWTVYYKNHLFEG